ncbi:hypothetical protein LCGC14_2191110 [marine sediment metagenome]|uniref:Uncharacterized protein n=1 Tax=marine sediment metagenome TaxID=412755 RepID=A0A0F9FWX9_9ZZZZ
MGIGSISLPRLTTFITLRSDPGTGERQNEFGFSADVRVLVNSSLRFRLLQELNGFNRGSNTWQRPASYAEILRKVGAFVPPELPPAFVTDTFMVALGNDDGTAVHEVRIHCETLPYDLSGPYPLIQESYAPSVEFVTLPTEGTSLYWDAGQVTPIKDDERPGFLTRIGTWTVIYHHLAQADVDYLRSINAWDLIGTVNIAKRFSPRFQREFAEETLLLEGLTLTAETDSIGRNKHQMTLTIAERRNTWNKFIRAGQILPQPMYDSSGAVFKPYDVTPWGNLVPVPPAGP